MGNGGVGHVGMGYPGVRHAGVGHAGMGYPCVGHAGVGHAGMGYPGVGHAGVGHPRSNRRQPNYATLQPPTVTRTNSTTTATSDTSHTDKLLTLPPPNRDNPTAKPSSHTAKFFLPSTPSFCYQNMRRLALHPTLSSASMPTVKLTHLPPSLTSLSLANLRIEVDSLGPPWSNRLNHPHGSMQPALSQAPPSAAAGTRGQQDKRTGRSETNLPQLEDLELHRCQVVAVQGKVLQCGVGDSSVNQKHQIHQLRAGDDSIAAPPTSPDHTPPDQTLPDQTLSDQTLPDQTLSDQTLPDHNLPDHNLSAAISCGPSGAKGVSSTRHAPHSPHSTTHTHIEPHPLLNLAAQMPALVSLELDSLQDVNDAVFRDLASLCLATDALSKLTCLRLNSEPAYGALEEVDVLVAEGGPVVGGPEGEGVEGVDEMDAEGGPVVGGPEGEGGGEMEGEGVAEEGAAAAVSQVERSLEDGRSGSQRAGGGKGGQYVTQAGLQFMSCLTSLRQLTWVASSAVPRQEVEHVRGLSVLKRLMLLVLPCPMNESGGLARQETLEMVRECLPLCDVASI
eukprot:gene13829-19747_t